MNKKANKIRKQALVATARTVGYPIGLGINAIALPYMYTKKYVQITRKELKNVK